MYFLNSKQPHGMGESGCNMLWRCKLSSANTITGQTMSSCKVVANRGAHRQWKSRFDHKHRPGLGRSDCIKQKVPAQITDLRMELT